MKEAVSQRKLQLKNYKCAAKTQMAHKVDG